MKQENEEKWIENLHKRMEDYSEPLPDGLWEELETELKTPKVVPFGVRWRAAAVVLVLLVSSLTVWFLVSPSFNLEEQNRVAEELLAPESEMAESRPDALPEHRLADVQKPDSGRETASPSSAVHSAAPSINARIGESDAKENTPVPSALSVVAEEVPGIKEKDEKETSDSKSSSAEESIKARRSVDREVMERNAYELFSVSKESKKRKGFSMGVLAGNTPVSSSSTYSGMGRLAAVSSHRVGNLMGSMDDKTAAYSQVLFENRELETKTDVNHHLPVTVGASFRWNINDDWALETGLMYTLLVSDSRSGEAAYMEQEQRLHYVGIPLKVQRSIWKNDRFAFYGLAGGAVEKCVSGKVKTAYVTSSGLRNEESESLDIDPLQWSVMAALGAQVNFTKQVGLYVEPGVAYYFDDKSGIETIRKEHPFNFNLQLGMRFSFGQ